MNERTSKFKIGDRVRTNKPAVLYKTGSVGKIIGLLDDKCRTINNGELSKEIEFDNGTIDVFYNDSSLDLITEEEPEMKRTSKFKVGDYVKVRDGTYTKTGECGIIKELFLSNDPDDKEPLKTVRFNDDSEATYYCDSTLELIPEEEPKNPEPFDFNEFVDETKHLKEDVLRLSCKHEALKNALVGKLDVTIPEMQKAIEQLKADVFRLQEREEEKPKEEVSFFDRFKNPQEMRQFFAEEREKSKMEKICNFADWKSDGEYFIKFIFKNPY